MPYLIRLGKLFAASVANMEHVNRVGFDCEQNTADVRLAAIEKLTNRDRRTPSSLPE